jgi:aspartyl-tRNA(Asn)/glutamyl-tRNA(Gln) amidotransferase subunit A
VTALEIAAAVRGRSLSARDVVEAALTRIADHNPRLNAFTEIFAERALARATALDGAIAAGADPGPLAGVPFAAKNLFDVAGVVTRAGAKVTAHDPPAAHDAELVALLEQNGAVLVGATNMDEFAYGFVTENAHDGPTHNPHDLTRIVGGSSGGSGAAVAAELVPLALASDTNGSIRVPAALCGIFGIRPTYGTLSCRGAYPFANSLDTVGPFARNATDLRAAFNALSATPALTAEPAAKARAARLGGYFEEGMLPAARAAVDAVCASLAAHEIVELGHARQAREAAFIITAAEAGALHAARLRTSADDYDPATRDRLIAGALVPAAWYARAQRFRTFFAREIAAAFAEHDVLVAAATPYPATPIGVRTIAIDGVETEIRPNLGVFTQPISLAGVPVVTVPIVAPDSLPVGVQLIGRAGSEALLLTLAEQLERAGVVGAGAAPVAA